MASYKKTLAFVQEEIRSLELAPQLNGCEMTAEWAEMLDIFRTIERVLKVIMDE